MKELYKDLYIELRGLLINPPKEVVRLKTPPFLKIDVEVDPTGENGVIYWEDQYIILPFHFGNLKQVTARLASEIYRELNEEK